MTEQGSRIAEHKPGEADEILLDLMVDAEPRVVPARELRITPLGAHKPGEAHEYDLTCKVCGQPGVIRLSIDPQHNMEAHLEYEALLAQLAAVTERAERLEAAGRDWHQKAITETNTSLHRMGHRHDPEAIRVDNEASEALYQAEDHLRGLFAPEWNARPDSTEAT